MAQEKIVKALCSVRGGHFGITFVQGSTDCWEATRTFRISSERSERGFGSSSLSDIRVGPGYAGCPYCENRNFFFCNSCQTLNCQGSAREENQRVYVRCASCGPVGYLQGLIEKLTGYGDV
jgi:hypothetical protein